MKVLLFRLRMCWLCLASNRAVLYCPRHYTASKNEVRVLGYNLLTADDWLALVAEGCSQHTRKSVESLQEELLAEARRLTTPTPSC